MVCTPVRSIIPSLKLGDYLSDYIRHTNHALSLTNNDGYIIILIKVVVVVVIILI